MATRRLFQIGLVALAALLILLLSAASSGYAQASAAPGRQAPHRVESSAQGKPGRALPTIVLVHGAWDNSTGWNEVIEQLQKRGYPVIAPANPLRALASDAAYISSILATIEGPVVLIGHSYGGAVITNAAVGHSNVKALVYIAAFVPEEGESLLQLSSLNPGSEIGQSSLIPRPYPLADGGVGVDLYLTLEAVRRAFAPDLPRRVADQIVVTQRPLAQAAFAGASGPPAWKTIPSWYLVASQDRTIPPATQRFMAQRAGAQTREVRSSHVVHISHPQQTLQLILEAADSVR
jgi:pimeloyl-ACP methyl ester carboxylesterase